MNRRDRTKPGKVVTTMVCLPPSMVERLDKKAEEDGSYSRSAVIRRACMAYLGDDKAESQMMQEAA